MTSRIRALGARFGWLASFGTSAVLHVTALGCLTLVAMSKVRPDESGIVAASFEIPFSTEIAAIDAQVQPAVVADASREEDELAAGPQPAGTQAGLSPGTGRPVVSLASMMSALPLDLSSSLLSKEELALSALGTKLGKGLSPGGSQGNGNGTSDGSGTGSQFFDLETAGTKVVYVLDRSESMQARHAAARNRLERVKTELIHSIGDLAGEMEFFVIFFNHNSLAMPAEKLQPATLENKRKYLEWCTKMKPGGATDPREALQRALDLQPDVIYLLTDGDFAEDVAGILRSQNTRGVPIHTICIGNIAGERQLREIARQHNGSYKFVQ